MAKRAILLGATGLTGGYLLNLLIENTVFDKIILLNRNSIEREHPKVEEHIVDLFKLKEYENIVKGDVLFCCIGTTKAKTRDKEKYRAIDYGIPVSAARLARENGIETFIVLSAMGASVNSNAFYNRTKGEMERDVLAQKITRTYVLRPSLIGGTRKESRPGEQFAKIVMRLFGFLVPKKYKIIQPETIAKAMLKLSLGADSKSILSSDEIKKLAADD